MLLGTSVATTWIVSGNGLSGPMILMSGIGIGIRKAISLGMSCNTLISGILGAIILISSGMPISLMLTGMLASSYSFGAPMNGATIGDDEIGGHATVTTHDSVGGVPQLTFTSGGVENEIGKKLGAGQKQIGLKLGAGPNAIGAMLGAGPNAIGLKLGAGPNNIGLKLGTGQKQIGLKLGVGPNVTGANWIGLKLGTGPN